MLARVRPIVLMSEKMLSQDVSTAESCSALITKMRFNLQMRSQMDFNVASRVRSIRAIITLKGRNFKTLKQFPTIV